MKNNNIKYLLIILTLILGVNILLLYSKFTYQPSQFQLIVTIIILFAILLGALWYCSYLITQMLILKDSNLEIHKKNQLLTEENKKVGISEKLKINFLNNLNHVFGTPLNGVIAYTDVLINTLTNDNKTQEILKKIKINACRIRDLLESIIYVSRLESNDINMKFEICNLEEIVTFAIRNLSTMLEERKIQIKFNTSIEDALIACDRIKLADALTEVIKNSIQYSNNESTVIINQTITNESVKLDVIDHGLGIPSYELDHVFIVFNTSSRTERGQGGIGMGLSIAKSIIEAHSGTIKIIVNHDAGVTVTINLPKNLNQFK